MHKFHLIITDVGLREEEPPEKSRYFLKIQKKRLRRETTTVGVTACTMLKIHTKDQFILWTVPPKKYIQSFKMFN